MNASLTPDERALLRGRQVRLDELESLRGWYPVVAADDGLWWRFLGEKKFSEPFFHSTLSSLVQTDRLYVHTNYDEAAKRFDRPLAPDAFIFHASRCGSTLLTQLFASLPDCIALSEPPAIDSFLRQHYGGRHGSEAEQRLRHVVSALGQRRFAEERHLFIKLDSWHIGSLPLFRRAFPSTPFLFVYREPAEILASHSRQRGRQMVPGLVTAAMPALDFTSSPCSLDEYCVKMLDYFFAAACRYADELRLVNYRQLPHLVWDDLLDAFSIAPSPEHLAAMKSRSGQHSKNGGQFTADPPSPCCTGNTTSAALHAGYNELERLRLRQGQSRNIGQ